MASYTDISRAINKMSAKNAVRKTLRSSLRDEWYPTLVMLHEESARSRLGKAASKEQLLALIAGWRSLGQAIDLDEIQEKMDYERRLRQQPQNCTWSECKYCTFQTGSSSRVTADLLDELPATLVTHVVAPANLYCVTPAPFPKKEMPLSAHE